MEEKYWKQFEASGRIEDYLSFVSGGRSESWGNRPTGQMREGNHAGNYISDRDRTETEPGRGI